MYGAPAPNPFEAQDLFALSNSFAPPTAVQMAAMAQHQANPFGHYQPTYQPQLPPQQHLLMGPTNPTNPFGDTGFGAFPTTTTVTPQQTNNPFGSTSLL